MVQVSTAVSFVEDTGGVVGEGWMVGFDGNSDWLLGHSGSHLADIRWLHVGVIADSDGSGGSGVVSAR